MSDTADDSNNDLRVWLVEDHRAYGERLLKTLNKLEGLSCDARFTACEDALAALQKRPPPDVVLLDLELPGMNGLEGIGRIRALAPDCAVVILTVFEDDEKVFKAVSAGAVGYMLKTASADEIVAGLRAAAAGDSPINPRIARRILDMFSSQRQPKQDYGLSPRETEILQLLVDGNTIKGVAAKLGISFYTADEYIRNVYKKLNVRDRGSAIAKALTERLIPPK